MEGHPPSCPKYFGADSAALSKLHLAGLVPGVLVWIGLSGWRIIGAGDGRLCRLDIRLGRGRITGLVDLVGKFVLCLLKFLHRLAKSTREIRQFLRPKEQKNDQQNDDQIGTAEVHDTGQHDHC